MTNKATCEQGKGPGFMPAYLREGCLDCGACDAACPEGCFVWMEGRDKKGRSAPVLRGIDYERCRACLRCVDACPVEALYPVEKRLLDQMKILPGSASPSDGARAPEPTRIQAGKGEGGEVEVRGVRLRSLASMARRVAPGPGTPPACGIAPSVNTFLKGVGGEVVILSLLDCPRSQCNGSLRSVHEGTRVLDLGAGVADPEAVAEIAGKVLGPGKLPSGSGTAIVLLTRAGGGSSGKMAAIAEEFRASPLILLEYVHEDFLRADGEPGRIPVDFDVPYFFTACETQPEDLVEKGAKAGFYARNIGFARGRILASCPPSAGRGSSGGLPVLKKALKCGIFPLFETESRADRPRSV